MDPLQTFIQSLRSITLSPEERARLRASLLAEMRAGSARAPAPSSLWAWFRETRRAQVALLLCVIFVGSGGALSLAAEGALPGETLYPIKRQVNERAGRIVHSVSLSSPTSFDTQLLEERLQEAEALDRDMRLEEPLRETVREAIREQSVKAERGVESNKESENHTSENARLKETLEKHKNILEKLELTNKSGNGNGSENANPNGNGNGNGNANPNGSGNGNSNRGAGN